jgi:hypothetical protein
MLQGDAVPSPDTIRIHVSALSSDSWSNQEALIPSTPTSDSNCDSAHQSLHLGSFLFANPSHEPSSFVWSFQCNFLARWRRIEEASCQNRLCPSDGFPLVALWLGEVRRNAQEPEFGRRLWRSGRRIFEISRARQRACHVADGQGQHSVRARRARPGKMALAGSHL